MARSEARRLRRELRAARAEIDRLCEQVRARGRFSDSIVAKASGYLDRLDQQRRRADQCLDLANRAIDHGRASERRAEEAEADLAARTAELDALAVELAQERGRTWEACGSAYWLTALSDAAVRDVVQSMLEATRAEDALDAARADLARLAGTAQAVIDLWEQERKPTLRELAPAMASLSNALHASPPSAPPLETEETRCLQR